MPALWADLDCPETELSNQFRTATAKAQEQFRQLRFSVMGYKTLGRVLNPHSIDRGGINYLDDSHCFFGQLIYHRAFVPSVQAEKEALIVSFTAVFENSAFSCTNSPETFEPLANHHVVRLKSTDLSVIHNEFIHGLNQRSEKPRPFPDLTSLRSWFDAYALATFEQRVRAGIWVRMSNYEVDRLERHPK